jgi:alkylhydroperoxidase family enzyme
MEKTGGRISHHRGLIPDYSMSASIPRLQLADMPPALADYLTPRVRRLGYLGELFQVSGHAPDVLLTFMQFTEALKDALPDKLAETAVLTTATLMENAYERNQHERLCVRLGFGRDWISDVERLEPHQAPHMSDDERAVQRYVVAAVTTHGLAAHDEFEDLAARLPAAQAVAIAMLVGRYVTHALVVNTFRLSPPVQSIWEDGFGLPETATADGGNTQ